MHNNKTVKCTLFALALLGFLSFSVWQFRKEQTTEDFSGCLGVPVVSQDSSHQKHFQQDYYNQLFFEGQRIAMDRETNTIYISQTVDEDTTFQDLQGKLELQNPFCSLSFLVDPMMEDLDSAVSQGHTFTLQINQPFSTYSEYNVVFTTFPVIRMDGTYSHSLEDERKVYHGELVIWEPGTDTHIVKSTYSNWHTRGGLTSDYPKKSWRLALLDEHRQKNDVSFLGFDADDDWILNPLVLDDTKMREYYNELLWNTLAESAPWNPVTSEGRYAELIRDGEYRGLYLLMRRLDAKYLGIDSQTDILLKGRPEWQYEDDGLLYEVQSSFLSQADSCVEVEKAISGSGNSINLQNFIDLNLLLQLNYGLDNCGVKNMYYLLSEQEDGFTLSWTPWDMDLTFANDVDKDLQEVYSSSLHGNANRRETEEIRAYVPDLDLLAAQRWQELRRTVFSDACLTELYSHVLQELEASGAVQRDISVWGQLNDGADTQDRFYQFILDRAAYLDIYYSNILEAE